MLEIHRLSVVASPALNNFYHSDVLMSDSLGGLRPLLGDPEHEFLSGLFSLDLHGLDHVNEDALGVIFVLVWLFGSEVNFCAFLVKEVLESATLEEDVDVVGGVGEVFGGVGISGFLLDEKFRGLGF